MARLHSKFVCQQCGYESTGWLGKCPSCGTWNSLVETVTEEPSRNISSGRNKSRPGIKPVNLSSVSSRKLTRITTKISELDRVLGGGLVDGQAVLLAGEPGIGKSTLLLQLSNILGNVLYVAGEESTSQISIRAHRLAVKNKRIQILEETNVDNAIDVIETAEKLSCIIVDSIQTMFTDDLTGLSGSVGQVRECASRLIRVAKSKGIPLIIVGHVTKEGTVAGPAILAHIVDTVLWFEGDKTITLRMLRAYKNRFGPTDEVGIFTMEDKGLVSVTDAQKIFLSKDTKAVSGSCITSILEGTRPILVEIQSLVVPTKLAFPKRTSQGFDARRLELMLAILQKRCGIPLGDFDVYVNVVGGVTIKDPGADLAVCLSIASSYFDKPLPVKLVAVGEVDLLGEIRPAASQEKRIKEAKRVGHSQVISTKEAKYLNQAIKSLR